MSDRQSLNPFRRRTWHVELITPVDHGQQFTKWVFVNARTERGARRAVETLTTYAGKVNRASAA